MRIPLKYRDMKENGALPVDVYIALYNDDYSHERDYVAELFDFPIDSDELTILEKQATDQIYAKYLKLRDQGFVPSVVAKIARDDGIMPIKRWRMLRYVFGLSLIQAKEATVISNGWESLDAYQEQLAEELEKALDAVEREIDDEDQ